MIKSKEIWKWAVLYQNGERISFKSFYKVSNFGRAKSVERLIYNGKNPDGSKRWKANPERIVEQARDKDGYKWIRLNKNGKIFWPKVHKLILNTFVGPCPEGMECRHFPDRNTGNNRLDNISWESKLVNESDKKFHGTYTKGDTHHSSKLTDSQVKKIRTKYRRGDSQTKLAREFGVTRSLVCLICNGKHRC